MDQIGLTRRYKSGIRNVGRENTAQVGARHSMPWRALEWKFDRQELKVPKIAHNSQPS